MTNWLRTIALTVILIPIALTGLALTTHALAELPPDIRTVTELPSGTSTWSIEHDGQTRTFRIYVPESIDRKSPAPLIVVLHGRLGTGRQAERAYGWNEVADAEGLVALYPDGMHRTWNAGSCCGYAARNEVDDVGFITTAIDQIEARISIDPARIYATGISNGGRMTYRLACETDRFAAIAPVAATLMVDCQDPKPVSVLHVHGLEDRFIRFDGSPGLGSDEVDGPPVPDVIAMWRAVNNCGAPVEMTQGSITRSVSTCLDGNVVELITLADAGHEWPETDDFDTTTAIWTFFASQSQRVSR